MVVKRSTERKHGKMDNHINLKSVSIIDTDFFIDEELIF